MNMLRGDIKKVICLLFSNLDFYFEKNGFKRRKNGLIYVHKIGETVQKIEIVFFFKSILLSRSNSTYLSSYTNLFSKNK